ncbi:MAG: DUF502 domain-containing protein [Gemmatimonadota bacterium]
MSPRNLRRYLLGGLAVIGPMGLSIWVLAWLFVRLDGLLGRYLDPTLGWSAPGVGLLVLVVLLLLVGWSTERALGARLVSIGDALMARLPVARQVYRGSRRIFRTVLGEDRIAFQEVVAFKWPDDKRWAIGFVTGSPPPEVGARLGGEAATVYMPTAPNPASGYLVMMARSDLVSLDVSVEEAFTFVLSAGSVSVETAQDPQSRPTDR